MENDNYGSVGDRVNVCSGCFGKLVSFMLTNPNLIKTMGLPKTLTAIPIEQGKSMSCEKCNVKIATGYIPCSKPESGERV